MPPTGAKNTYSGNQWTIENPDQSKNNYNNCDNGGKNDNYDDDVDSGKVAQCTTSTVHELTKDLMMMASDDNNNNNDIPVHEEAPPTQELDWDLEDRKDDKDNDDENDDVDGLYSSVKEDDGFESDDDDNDEEEKSNEKKTPGCRKKKNTTCEKAESRLNDDDDDESIEMASGKHVTVSHSHSPKKVNNQKKSDVESDDDDESDDESDDDDDKTVAMSDDDNEDDMTVAMMSEDEDVDVDIEANEMGNNNINSKNTKSVREEILENNNNETATDAITKDDESDNFNSDLDDLSKDSDSDDNHDTDTDTDTDTDNDVKKVKDRQRKKKKKEDNKKDEEDEDEDEASADDSNLDLIGMFDDKDDDDDNRKKRETGKNIKKQLGDIEKDQDSAADDDDDTDNQKEDTEEFPTENELDANGNSDANEGDFEDEPKKVADYHSDLAQSARQRPVRARKPKAPYSAESKISALATASSSTRENSNSTSKMKKKTTSAGINKQELIIATDAMFVETEDKSTVTVKHFFIALEEKFEFKMTKQWKGIVRDHLKALISNKVKPSCDADTTDDKVVKKKVIRPKRLSKRKSARATKVMEAQKLRRKKRMDELKIHNEEMQLNQTKEDEERQEAIAAKFETNSDELRLKRLEDRLDLLQRLDETRISIVEKKKDTPVKKEEEKLEMGLTNDVVKEESSESEESSSDEEDLVIVGMKKPMKPLEALPNHLPSRCVTLLNEIRSPKNKKAGRTKHKQVIRNKNKNDGMIMSPGRSMGARFALRNSLKQKQRKVGNRWLARELGYKTEEDHLKDCKTAAEVKRGIVVKLEQERLKANERKQLRERIMLQEPNAVTENDSEEHEYDPDDEAYTPPAEDAEEEDEEMKMAKEIEQEAKEKDLHKMKDEDHSGTANDNNEMPTAKDTQEKSPALASKADLNKNCIDTDNEEAETQPLETQPFETQPPYISNRSIKSDTKEGNESGSNPSEKISVLDSSYLPEKDPTSFAEVSLLETQHELLGGFDKVCKSLVAKDSELVDGQMTDTRPISPFDSNIDNDPKASTERNDFSTETVTAPADESVVTPEKKDKVSYDEEEVEFDDNDSKSERKMSKDPNRSRNAGWQAMLKREAETFKKQKKRKGGLVEEEAEEEEEEEEVAGLEDFGFSISKKRKDNDDEGPSDKIDEDDLKYVVDDVSDDEGDEDAGRVARTQLEQREEKDHHKEILRRMREGYDGRRGGIAGGGTGARGVHRFDQLVAADNRDDAKRLGLLNDDEQDSEDEKEGEKSKIDDVDEEDETVLLDKMLKDRFLHRSDVDLEENFSDEEDNVVVKENPDKSDDEEERSQERLAKRFAKRARMQRLEETYGDSQEFSQQRLIDEDSSMREELSSMRCGLVRRFSSLSRLSSHSSNTSSRLDPLSRKRQRSAELSSSTGGGSHFQKASGSLSIALRASQKKKHKSSFLGGSKAVDGKEMGGVYKTVQLGHVIFNNQTSQSQSGFGSFSNSINSNKWNSNTHSGKQQQGSSTSSLFSKVSGVA